MSESFPISAVLICKNEEVVIERALQSLTFADEIIVVDAESTDQTREICRRYTENITIRPWKNFGDQRSFALSLAKHSWVFVLDADEICSPDLQAWMFEFKQSGPEVMSRKCADAPISPLVGPPKKQDVELFSICRWEYFKGTRLSYGFDSVTYQWRFFLKDGAAYINEVHEYPKVDGRVVKLETPIFHHSKSSIVHLMNKVNKYTTFEAQRFYRQGVKKNISHMFFSGLSKFFRCYFSGRYYRGGVHGFILAMLEATSSWLRQAKLYLIWKDSER